MKQKIKDYLKIGILLLGVTITLNSCVKDDDLREYNTITQTKPSLSTTKIYFDDIKANKTVFSKITKVKAKFEAISKTKSNNRTISNEDSGLTINTNFANLVEYESGYHSYTFMVSNTPEGEGLKNVLLSLQQDGTYKEYLVSYNFDANDLYNLENGLEIDFTNKVNFTELSTDFSSQLFQRVVYQDGCTTISIVETPCQGEAKHPYGDNRCQFPDGDSRRAKPDAYSISNTCSDGPNSGGSTDTWFPGGDTSGGHNTGGNTGNGGPNSTPTYCSPSKCPSPDDTNIEDLPCNKVKQQVQNPDYQQAVEDYLGNFSDTEESGFEEDKYGNFNELNSVNNGHSLDFSPNVHKKGATHIHINPYSVTEPNGDVTLITPIRMPSPQDVIDLLILTSMSNGANQTVVPISDLYINMYSSTGNYTIKFNGDPTTINLNYDKEVLKEKYKTIFKKMKDLELAFLTFIKNEMNVNGIELYKIEDDLSINKKELAPSTNEVNTTPCP